MLCGSFCPVASAVSAHVPGWHAAPGWPEPLLALEPHPAPMSRQNIDTGAAIPPTPKRLLMRTRIRFFRHGATRCAHSAARSWTWPQCGHVPGASAVALFLSVNRVEAVPRAPERGHLL